ncbi:MAG TPA: CoA ester lyase [Ignavibacteriales bacterium]|nr:CoA ester lyase [Ignavibacteriales bacterium]
MKLRRSILSVPGHIQKMHHKAANSNTDSLILDLEDSVPLNDKELARKTIVDSLKIIDFGNKFIHLRINSIENHFSYKDLLEIIPEVGDKIDSILLPKVDTEKDVYFVQTLLEQLKEEYKIDKTINISISIESAAGLENISTIVKTSNLIDSIHFGIADYSSSIGAKIISISGHGENEENIYPGHRWAYVHSKIVNTAKAYNLLAFDAPFGNFKDPEGLKKSAQIALALGFDGKWAIHPEQIEIINNIFTPQEEEITRAKMVIEALEEAKRNGKGAVSIDGRMVDHATIRLAKVTLEKAKIIEMM